MRVTICGVAFPFVDSCQPTTVLLRWNCSTRHNTLHELAQELSKPVSTCDPDFTCECIQFGSTPFGIQRSTLVTASGDRSRTVLTCIIHLSPCFASVASTIFVTCLPPSSVAKCSAHLARPSSSLSARPPLLSLTPVIGVGLKDPSCRASLYSALVSPRSAASCASAAIVSHCLRRSSDCNASWTANSSHHYVIAARLHTTNQLALAARVHSSVSPLSVIVHFQALKAMASRMPETFVRASRRLERIP